MGSLNLVPANVEDYRRLAEKRLPRFLFDYVDGGAYSEWTLRRNVADLEALTLNQRVLHDVSALDPSCDLFGRRWTMPIALAPVGLGGMAARRGEVQAKRAADALGIPFCLSTVSICPLEEVAAASAMPFWFQLYMLRDRGVVEELLQRAWAVGVRTLVFTVDLAVVGMRYRDVRNGMTGGAGAWGRLRAGLFSYLSHPRWLMDVAIGGRPHVFGNLAAYVPKASSPADFRQWIDGQLDPSVTWKDIEWLRAIWKGELVIKGVLAPEDARAAVATGAEGVIVSNHGGRQLDGVPSSIRMLGAIADAMAGKAAILMDGGIRNGQDVAKAVACGADAVLIGRPWVYALAARGEAGLGAMLDAFRGELEVTMALTGATTLAGLDKAVARPGSGAD